ncbi:hypothetical protein POX_f08381 [Penicillium oxalicum]|uniref:hypothetical protein n=1 Tax=Penicillium oxalicum TaxID=69781 RepID=UPI0020B6D19A|nr:hypothetical protein POX_f08381 [Penicillium oxalicum]KAI2787998.1 hypothetical protein POX_f08381 [Penicillium oxalicum]
MHWSVYGSLLATLGAHSVSGSHHHHARPRWIRPESAPEHLKSHNADWMEHVRPGPSLETRTFTTTVYKECQFTHSINATSHITASLIHVPTHRAVVPTSGLSTASVSESPTTLYTSLLHMTPTGSKTTQAVPTVVISNESQPTTAKPTTFHIHMTTTVTISETTHPTVLTTLSASNAPNHTWIATSSRPGLPISSASSATSSPTGSVHQPSTTLLPNLLSSVSHLAPLPILGDAPAGIPSHLPLPDLPPLPVNPTLIPTPSTISQVLDWTAAPLNGIFTTERFGARSKPSGERVLYSGNVGIPWGSNIILVSHEDAHNYKYVAQFKGSKTQPWTITFWNKFGPEGKMDGWYGHSALTFALPAGETRYIAFDENSQGAWVRLQEPRAYRWTTGAGTHRPGGSSHLAMKRIKAGRAGMFLRFRRSWPIKKFRECGSVWWMGKGARLSRRRLARWWMLILRRTGIMMGLEGQLRRGL